MADFLTAGTFVGAVLEQSGYLVQSRFLRDFRDFFREAGAFIYLLGGIGGVVSFVLYGSFRAARYLVLGPILYWFLIGPTMKFDGVSWQIGGGAPRDFYRKLTSINASAKSVEDIVKDAGIEYDGNVEVAYFFGLYAKVINTVTRDLSLEIINQDDKEYQHYISKARGLQYLILMDVDNPLLKDMFEKNLMTDCMWMTGAALDMSSYDIHPDALAVLTSGAKKTNQARRDFNTELVENGKKDYISLKTGTSSGLTQYLAAQFGDNLPGSISCDDVWKYVAQAITEFAEQEKPKLMQVARGNLAEADEGLVCERIREKLVEEGAAAGGGDCDLTNLIALFALKNLLARQPVLARFAQWVANDSYAPGMLSNEEDLSNAMNRLGSFQGSKGMVLALSRRQQLKQQRFKEGVEMASALTGLPLGGMAGGDIYNQRQKGIRNARWSAEAKMQSIGGGADPAFIEMPMYQMRNLRQQLFSWSLQMPFWQGLLLYLLAMIYPFFALVVLLPGRGASFLLLPMAWLWVKSWDVGFACVMVFERVLWNIMPSLRIRSDLLTTPLKDVGIIDALAEAQKFDHIFNLNMYYTLLALATFSVPMVAGMATIKAKRSVLSSFTDKLVEDVKQAGGQAAAAYQYGIAADRSRMQQDLMGLAAQTIGKGGQGIDGGGREQQAALLSAMAASAQAVSGAIDAVDGKGAFGKSTKGLAAGIGAARKFLETQAKIVDAEAKFERAQVMAFDPILGYHGMLQQYAKAYAVAMDTSGGFELSGQSWSGSNTVDDYINLVTTKINTLVGVGEAGAGVLVESMAKVGAVTPAVLGMGVYAQLQTMTDSDREAMVKQLEKFAAELAISDEARREELKKAIEKGDRSAIPDSLLLVDGMLRDRFGENVANSFFRNALSFTPEAMNEYKSLIAKPKEEQDQLLRRLMPQNYMDLIESVNPYTPDYVDQVEVMPQYFATPHSIPGPDQWPTLGDLNRSEAYYYPRAQPAPSAAAEQPANSPAAAIPPAAGDAPAQPSTNDFRERLGVEKK